MAVFYIEEDAVSDIPAAADKDFRLAEEDIIERVSDNPTIERVRSEDVTW